MDMFNLRYLLKLISPLLQFKFKLLNRALDSQKELRISLYETVTNLSILNKPSHLMHESKIISNFEKQDILAREYAYFLSGKKLEKFNYRWELYAQLVRKIQLGEAEYTTGNKRREIHGKVLERIHLVVEEC